MIKDFPKLLKRSYKPLNIIEISKNNLLSNYKYLFNKSNLITAPVLKSNAYGHGIVEVAKILDNVGAPFFCVDSLYEAYALLNSGIKTKILIMGFIDPVSLDTKSLPFSFAVFTKKQLLALSKNQTNAKIHIFVDTGMHREGVTLDDLPDFIKIVKKTKLVVEGVMSHFGESEAPNNIQTKKQCMQFEKALGLMKATGINPKYVHFANSSGILNSRKFETLGNVVRAGISLYGIDPIGIDKHLKPVLSFKTHIAQVKTLKKGESIGYNFTFTAKKSTKIAILPVGYNDGVDRKLSNVGYAMVKNNYCKFLGLISMNIAAIDVSNFINVEQGMEVTIFSANPKDNNSICNSARLTNTIPYELLVHLHPSTKRIVV